MTMTLLQLQVLNWRSFSYIISANLFALLFHFILINDVRITTFTHQLLSRKNINARSLTMRVRIFQPQCYVPVAVLCVGYAEVIFIQPDGKLDTIWRDAWQRLASSYPTSRWDVAINLMVTAAGRCSLSHRQKHRNLQRDNLQFTLCTE